MELWMSIIGLSMAFGVIPQILRLWKRKSGDDMSAWSWVILIHALCWWLYYGVTIGSICLVVTNVVAIALDTILLVMILRYRPKGKTDAHIST